jgi:hypothetical protein
MCENCLLKGFVAHEEEKQLANFIASFVKKTKKRPPPLRFKAPAVEEAELDKK